MSELEEGRWLNSNGSAENGGWQPLSDDMAHANNALGIVMCVYAAINFLFVVIDLTAPCRKKSWFYHRRDKLTWKKVVAMRGLLFGTALSNALTFIVTGLPAFNIPFDRGLEACTWIVRAYSLGYTISLQLVFIFFIVRSSFVEGLIKTRMFNLVSQVTKIGLILFCPAFVLPYVFIALEGFITPDGVCIAMTINLWFIISFIVGIAVLTGVTIFLFTTPLRRSIAASTPGKTAGIKRVMYRNIIFNLIGMMGSLICLSLFAYENHRLEVNSDTVRGIIFSTTDLFILGICSRGMLIEEKDLLYIQKRFERWCCRATSGSDRPTRKKRRCCRRSGAVDDESLQGTSNTRSSKPNTVRPAGEDGEEPTELPQNVAAQTRGLSDRTTLPVETSALEITLT